MSKFSWSYSSLTKFEQCPAKWAWSNEPDPVTGKKNKEPDTPEQARGHREHKAMEDRAKGIDLPLDLIAYEKYGRIVDRARGAGLVVMTEQRVAVNRNFKPTEFFAKDAWLRGVIDLAILSDHQGQLWDWKTGKVKDDPTQLELFAAVSFIEWPHIDEYRVGNVWLKALKTSEPVVYTHKDTLRIWSSLLPRVERMEREVIRMRAAGEFEVHPGPLCGWCPNKQCDHWVERK